MELRLGHRRGRAARTAPGSGSASFDGRWLRVLANIVLSRVALTRASTRRAHDGHRPGHRRIGFVGSHVVPALIAGGHRVLALVRAEAPGQRCEAATAARPASLETRIGDVNSRPRSRPRDGRRRRRRPPRRPAPRLDGGRACTGSTSRAPATWSRRRDGRDPAVRPPGRAGGRRRSRPALRELEGPGRWRSSGAARSTGRSSSLRCCSASATGSSTSSPAWSGCRPAWSRSRATARPLPAAGDQRPGARRGRRRSRDDATIGQSPARRPALLDLSRDHREVLAADGQAADPRPDARARDPPGRRTGRARPPSVPRGHRPAPPAQVRQYRPPGRRSRRRSGSRPAPWKVASARPEAAGDQEP